MFNADRYKADKEEKQNNFEKLANLKAKQIYNEAINMDLWLDELSFEEVKTFTKMCIVAFDGGIFGLGADRQEMTKKLPEVVAYIAGIKTRRMNIFFTLKAIFFDTEKQELIIDERDLYTLLGICSAFLTEYKISHRF